MSFASSARRALGGAVAAAAVGSMGFAAPGMAEPQTEPRNRCRILGALRPRNPRCMGRSH